MGVVKCKKCKEYIKDSDIKCPKCNTANSFYKMDINKADEKELLAGIYKELKTSNYFSKSIKNNVQFMTWLIIISIVLTVIFLLSS